VVQNEKIEKEKEKSIPKRVRSSSSSTGIKPKGCMKKEN